jgi:rhodanese-related sulfurtransferase
MPGDHPGSPADAAEGTYATAGTRGYVIQPMRRSLPGVHRRRNDTGNFRGERMTVDDLLAEARSALPLRPGPAEALAAQAKGALLIDIRGDDQRRASGLIPGALVLPRNSLEWRCDPASPARHPAINDRSRSLILICNEGFQSSLAAATLHRLGLVNATDLDGGFIAWATAGLPVVPTE